MGDQGCDSLHTQTQPESREKVTSGAGRVCPVELGHTCWLLSPLVHSHVREPRTMVRRQAPGSTLSTPRIFGNCGPELWKRFQERCGAAAMAMEEGPHFSRRMMTGQGLKCCASFI